jgi:hypothetical protein
LFFCSFIVTKPYSLPCRFFKAVPSDVKCSQSPGAAVETLLTWWVIIGEHSVSGW